jgi:hypothetical protein
MFLKKSQAGPRAAVAEMKAAVEAPEKSPEAMAVSMPALGKPEEFAPLFVKVEKYREVLTHLGEIKAFIGGIKQIFLVQEELDGIRSDGLRMLRSSINRLERAIGEVDSELLKPVGLESFPHGEVEMKHIEDSLTRLQSQLSGLRKDLESFKE